MQNGIRFRRSCKRIFDIKLTDPRPINHPTLQAVIQKCTRVSCSQIAASKPIRWWLG